MASRVELQVKLVELLGSNNVYYQPPSTIQMSYPAIVYTKSNIRSRRANNGVYSFLFSYDVTVIDKRPDNPVIQKLLELPHCSFDRHYVADNLNHDVLTLYY